MTNPNHILDLHTAMMLLEMHGTEMFGDKDAEAWLIVGAHQIIQRVSQSMQGSPETGGEVIAETLAIVWSRVAIADAKGPLFKE